MEIFLEMYSEHAILLETSFPGLITSSKVSTNFEKISYSALIFKMCGIPKTKNSSKAFQFELPASLIPEFESGNHMRASQPRVNKFPNGRAFTPPLIEINLKPNTVHSTVNTFQFNLICFYGSLESTLALIFTEIEYDMSFSPVLVFRLLWSTWINSVSTWLRGFHQEMTFIVSFDFDLQGFAHKETADDNAKPIHVWTFLCFFCCF